MSRKVWKNIAKSIIFLFLLCIVFTKVLDVFNYKDMGGGGGWQRFYEMPKETIDVIFFGSSHAHCTIEHGILWDEYGMAGYTLSAGSQHLDSTYYFVKEALRVQRPKLLVVEVWGAVLPGLENGNESVYRNSLGMKLSSNLFEFVEHLSNDIGENADYRNRILAKFPIIHSRYKELVKSDFRDETPYMMGYRGSFGITEIKEPAKIAEDTVIPLDAKCEEYVYKIINLAKEHEVDLLFIASPYLVSDGEQMLLNRVGEIAQKENIPFINYNRIYKEIDMDYKKDFRDFGHLNNYGAQKVTSHLAAYIRDNFDVPDRRGQKGYENWDLNSRYLEGKRQAKVLLDAHDVNIYLKELSEIKDKTVVLSLTGNHTAAGDVYYEGLSDLGISYEEYLKGGVWIFENGNPTLCLAGKEYNQCYKVKDNEIHLEAKLVVEDGEEVQQAAIIFEGKNYSLVQNGINVLIYDQLTGQIIDTGGVDIYIGFNVIREGSEQ